MLLQGKEVMVLQTHFIFTPLDFKGFFWMRHEIMLQRTLHLTEVFIGLFIRVYAFYRIHATRCYCRSFSTVHYKSKSRNTVKTKT